MHELDRACVVAALGVAPAPAGLGARLMVEAFGTSLAVIAAIWLAWVALWLLEQRW